VSTHTQRFLENLISDRTWCREFIRKNKAKLLESYTLVKDLFENQLNIKIIEANAGIFVWADFSDYLEAQTFEAELKLFDKILTECQVSISPGQFFESNTPGWFRVCFAQKEEQIITAVKRLKKTLVQ
jgi:1-aminocyclopropane-1-carboxylate synthase